MHILWGCLIAASISYACTEETFITIEQCANAFYIQSPRLQTSILILVSAHLDAAAPHMPVHVDLDIILYRIQIKGTR